MEASNASIIVEVMILSERLVNRQVGNYKKFGLFT